MFKSVTTREKVLQFLLKIMGMRIIKKKREQQVYFWRNKDVESFPHYQSFKSDIMDLKNSG